MCLDRLDAQEQLASNLLVGGGRREPAARRERPAEGDQDPALGRRQVGRRLRRHRGLAARRLRARVAEQDEGRADPDQVAVAQPAAAGHALLGDKGAVAREAIVDHEPLAAEWPQLGVELGHLRVPREPDIHALAATERHRRVVLRQDVQDQLALGVAVCEERRTLPLRGELALQLAGGSMLDWRASLHAGMVASRGSTLAGREGRRMNDGGQFPTEPAGQGGDDTLKPGASFAGLAVEAEVGRGGMGVVYRVRDPALDRVRALKVLPPERSGQPAFRERFQRESRQAAAIEHPAVTTVYAAGEADGRLYLVMRFVDGPSLSELIDERRRLPLDETVGILSQIAGALDAAHAAGLVHRDVKPGNVLLEGSAPDWRAFLCDFGISKLAEDASRLTSTGQFVGTVDYVAPEQIEGGAVDARADVYSLACVAYHALAGEPPFRRESQIATMFAHANADRPLLSAPDVPPAVGRTLQRAMAVRPDERHASAGALVAELKRLAGDAARATTSSMRRRPPPKRPRRTAIAVGSLAAVLAAAAGVVLAVGGGTEGDVGTVDVAGAVEVPPRPVAVTAGPGRVWVASPAAGSISSIVPGRDRTEQEVRIGGEPVAVAVGLDWVWVADRERDELLRVDPSTGRVDQRVRVGAEPSDVVVSESDVWVANAAGETVTRIDPGTDSEGDGREGDDPARVADEAIPVGGDPMALAVGGRVIWVVNRGDDSVSVIEIEGSRRDGNPVDVGEVPNDVAVGEGSVWVTDDFSGELTPIDPASREPGEPIEVGEHPRGVAVGLGYVWVVSGENGTVVRVDPETRDVVGEPVPVGAKPADIAVGSESVWTADYGATTVTELRLAD